MRNAACTLSREVLLALYLVTQAVPVSRIKEIKVLVGADGTGRAVRHRWGHCGKVLYGSVATRRVRRACFLFVLSLKWCGATRRANCSEVGADALSCQGQSHDETPRRQAHTFTSPLSISPAEGTPLLPLPGQLGDSGIFFSIWRCPQGAASCADTSRAGRSASHGGGEGSSCCCLIQPGWSRDNGNITPHSAISGKSLPGFKDLAPVVKPSSGCGTSCTGLVVMKSSTCCKYQEELHKELQHLILYRASLHLFQQAPESSMVHFPALAG